MFLSLQPEIGRQPERIILKHGQGGLFTDASSLATFIRNVRCGDRIQVHVALIEKLSRSGAAASSSSSSSSSSETAVIHTSSVCPSPPHPQADALWHASSASILEMHVQGNTGAGRSVAVVENAAGGVTAEAGAEARGVADGTDDDQLADGDDENDDDDDDDGAAGEGGVDDEEEDDPSHQKSSKERFQSFADFIIATFQLPPSSRIIEVAGGAGALSLLLSLAGYEVLLVDPRSNAGLLSRRLRKQMRASAVNFSVSNTYFLNDSSTKSLIADFKPDLIVGLHPDEATDAIVDAAVASGVPFAVVPCCTYGRLFPGRRGVGGRPVRTHKDLCGYLRRKITGGCEVGKLKGIQGKTTVIFHRGKQKGGKLQDDDVCGNCAAEETASLPL